MASTARFPLVSGQWTAIAAGPGRALLQRVSTAGAVMIVAGSTPALDAPALALDPSSDTDQEIVLGAGDTIYARALAGDTEVRVVLMDTEASASGKDPVIGAFTGTGRSAPFVPVPGRNFNISVWGGFTATVRLERSFDGGTTYLPVTADSNGLLTFTGPVSEQWNEPEAGVSYTLNCTAFTSGPVNFRISQ